MTRITAAILTAWLMGSTAQAQESSENTTPSTAETAVASPSGPTGLDVAWTGVYERSGKTVKAGEWMGIAGGSMMVIGLTTAIIGGVNIGAGGFGMLIGSGEGGQQATQGAGMVVGGGVVGLTGFVGFQTGPALMAGGTTRQAKAIRQVNPSAPRPWLGYSSWVPWAMGLTPSVGSFILQPIAYVLAGMQKGKNRLNWDARTAAYLEKNQPKVTVNLTPISIDGNRGLALVGSF